jgi:excisionase family DNA binding protein
MPEILLDHAELQRRLDCSRSMAYLLTSSGALRTVRLGRAVRVPESAVEDFIKAGGARVIPRSNGHDAAPTPTKPRRARRTR